jgi:hypothetical protein
VLIHQAGQGGVVAQIGARLEPVAAVRMELRGFGSLLLGLLSDAHAQSIFDDLAEGATGADGQLLGSGEELVI